MKVAIMQPYFFPYIGYFQLMNAVDEFVVYDDIEFTKKGWINRNRILVNGSDSYITIPLKSDSDYLNVRERYLADSWPLEKRKLLNKIKEAYRKAPFFDSVFPLIEKCILFENDNLFHFIYNSIVELKQYLSINTKLIVSSSLNVDNSLKSVNKVVGICKNLNTSTYINAIGGINLYDKNHFKEQGIDLHFIKSKEVVYKQFDAEFVPWLSIIDVLMFNSIDETKALLNNYELI